MEHVTSKLSLEDRYRGVQSSFADVNPGGLNAAASGAAMDFARAALKADREELSVEVLTQLLAVHPDRPDAWQLLGFAYAREQRLAEAVVAFSHAAKLRPDDLTSALAFARASLDAGYDARESFEAALRLAPGNLDATGGWAAALAAQGERAAAESALAQALRQCPDWLFGHRRLAALRYTSGDSSHFASSYAEACSAQPQNLAVRMAWFGAIALTQQWEEALKIVAEGEALLGAAPAFSVARAYVASESGNRTLAEQLFAQTASIQDDVLKIAHIRHCLRTARLAQAERLALGMIPGSSASLAWPYLSVIWRLCGDPRARWLDGEPPPVRIFELDYSAAELARLTATLGRIATAALPHVEQSVRGGIQTDTDQQLFFRHEPEIQQLRSKVAAAIHEYVAGLPGPVAGHPLLGAPRHRIRFSGSWSVRLKGGGFHVSHTHPKGWISSAFYASSPDRDQLGATPAGCLALGRPPATLGLDLPPYAEIEPKPGRLVLFPSTVWHETIPFDRGERVVVAFDVSRPAG